jgi:hypothetical protein
MKPRKSLILAYSIASVLGTSAGLAYGFYGPYAMHSTYNLTWDMLETHVRMNYYAPRAARLKKIDFVSAAWTDPDYPQLQIEFKNSPLKAVLKRPSLKQVELLLQQAEFVGLDFDQVYLIPTAMYNHRSVVALIKNGKRSEDYHSPPSFVLNESSPPDYVEHFRQNNPLQVVKSPGQATPKYTETTSGGTETDEGFTRWKPEDASRYFDSVRRKRKTE